MSVTSFEKNQVSEEELKDIVLDWRALKSKRQKRRKFKDYQEQLLKEIPGAANRTNVAMHAVIDVTADGGENQTRGMGASTEIRNQALIHYIARLANSNNDDDEFDFSFVESLLENGANINTADKYGQTMFHEVARSWNVDVARFLLNRGANINQQDKYGRAPLHVAAAVDYTEMIEFLLQHKADIDITTFGELQTPIHVAAKNDACQALKLLINYGSNVNCRDYQNRTPIQVAASMSRTKAARYLVELGTPTGVYDHNGEMTLSLLILKMPEVATIALDQFRSQDMINRKEYNFLNYVEGPRIFEGDPRENKARSPLEVAIQYEQYSIVMHPVMKRLINMKWEYFGKKGARNDLIVNVVFAFVWTILGITLPLKAHQLYWPLKNYWWRLFFAMAGVFLTGFELYKQVSSFIYMNKAIRRWKAFREKTLWNDKRFCHPKWRDENEYLEKEIKDAREERFFTRQDGWLIVDWIALLLIVAGIASHISFLVIGSKLSRDVHVRIVSFILIVLYVRLLKFARPFEGPGPFVASIAPMLKDFVKWSVLFCLLFIPYASIFWMIFGPTNKENAPVLSDVPGLIFTVFSMAAYSNLSIVDELVNIDKNMARLLIGSFVAISSIVTLNLLIAMLADTFTRMYENSVETATMQRAKTILYLEQKLSSTVWRQYCEHIQKECSPEVCSFSEDMTVGRRDKKRKKEKMLRSIEEIHTVINDRLGSKVGTEKSDMDQLLAGVNKLNCRLDSFKPRAQNSGATLTNPGSINLNIILDHRDERNSTLNGVALKSEESPNQKTQCDHNRKSGHPNQNSKDSVETIKQHKSTEATASSSSSTSSNILNDENERGITNEKIQRQLDVILNLMKEAIKNGKLHFTINGKALLTKDKESVEHLLKTENNGVQHLPDCVHGTVYSSCSYGVMNPVCSPLLSQLENECADARPSSPDLYTSDEVFVYTPVESPDDKRTVDHSSVDAERLNARYEGSSFLSTSSDGNITCDETTGFTEMSSSQTSVFSNTSEQKIPPNQPGPVSRRCHKRIQPPITLFLRAPGSCHGESSEYDVNGSEVRRNVKKNEEIQASRLVCEDDFSSSSQGTASTDPSYPCDDDDSQASSVSHYIDTTEVTYSTSPERDDLMPRSSKDLPRVPHVRWADTASEACSIPFLNIHEISASSDHFSGDTRLESDAVSGDEEQSGFERNTGQQTEV